MLYDPLPEAQIAEFERTHGITLPSEYRDFILGRGNGGDSFFKLGEIDSGWDFVQWDEAEGVVGDLAKPFPFDEPWNDLTNFIDWDPDASEEKQREYEEKREAFDLIYYRALDGALPLAHLGCAIRLWLVVTGPERGYIWYDDRANLEGLRPLARNGERVGFLAWYGSEANDG